MAFSQANITDGPNFHVLGAELQVSWSSSSPAGTWAQIYANDTLIWHGTARSVLLPYPQSRVVYRVGEVDPAEAATDLSSTLPPLSGSGGAARVKLTWQGGTFLGDDIDGYHVYGESTPGGGIDYGTVLATIPAYSGNVVTDGWGMGGWGEGGWGRAPASYSWTSDPLSPGGTWHFGVRPFDRAGNEGTAAEASFAVSAPPRPPAADASGNRLAYSYDSGTGVATLTWQASP